ncbi:MAG TPA: hypothetical protein VF766_12675 [Pyrinomonadaceae bacterium]
MMRKLLKILFILALLSWGALGLRHAQGQRDKASLTRGAVVAPMASDRRQVQITINAGDGSFVMQNLTLTKMAGSTVLRGNVLNKSKHKREQVSFLVRAYGRDGLVLKGLESETVFTAQELKANSSVPINHGYGVWLQGILTEDIARIEISEIGQAHDIPIMAWIKPLEKESLDLASYAEIEE